MTYLMKCGHVANAVSRNKDGSSKPVCVICAGITPDADIVVKECEGTKGLEGRKAKCTYRSCNSETDSSWNLPFFKYEPDEPCDRYYCGCLGWD